MITAASATTQHLQTIIDRWSDLTDALAARQQATWPPTMGVARLVADLDAEEHTHIQRIVTRRDEHGRPAYECASCDHVGDGRGHPTRPDRDQPGPGTSPAPISIDVLDVMREVEAELVHLADVTAAEIQRPTMSRAPRGAAWTPAEIARRDQLAAQDAADPRRWRYPGTRSAVYAAAWLAARIEGRSGPFLPLGPTRTARIATVAAAAADRVETALRIARRATAVEWPCPVCRGLLEVHGGDGEPPVVKCADCGRSWQERESAAA
ncbi:hypothetical protein [Streptomyces sp. RTd22]|uniref:hypothetical protein n=1 Tax=Streptomyces sp. RTd22 TaxID=1841249 RepID=UPI0007C5AA2C|nr:hypothetical protein [Streptomyces sp. RTd22]